MFLKFLQSVVPTIDYDFTNIINGDGYMGNISNAGVNHLPWVSIVMLAVAELNRDSFVQNHIGSA